VRALVYRILTLAAALATSCAGPASLNGMLIPRRFSPDERLDHAVVYVESKSRTLDQQFPARADRVPLRFTGGRIEPVVTVATTGSWLEMWNADTVFHQPFSRSLAAPFEGRSVRPGAGTVVRLRAKGLVQVFCQLHDGESAELLVLDNSAWARPDITGAFTLPALPRGHYVLHAWHPRLGEQAMPLEVGRSGPVSVELRY
jgi:hypothetical protein